MDKHERELVYSLITRLCDLDDTLTRKQRLDILNELCLKNCNKHDEDILNNAQKRRRLQTKRGSASENEAFTGLPGEITFDTTNNTLRVHDGTTVGGVPLAKQSEIPEIANADYVVESQLPTAENNYTWYRKYKSGWVEQGGTFGPMFIQYSEIKIILPVPMADANYCGFVTTLGNAKNYTPQLAEKATTYVKFGFVINLADFGATWLVQGMSAPSE